MSQYITSILRKQYKEMRATGWPKTRWCSQKLDNSNKRERNAEKSRTMGRSKALCLLTAIRQQR
jgi:hypothetical protein